MLVEKLAGSSPTGGGVLTATPGSSARHTRGKGTPEGLVRGFQDPYGFWNPKGSCNNPIIQYTRLKYLVKECVRAKTTNGRHGQFLS